MSNVTELRARHEAWTRGGHIRSELDGSEINALEDRAAATVGDSSPMGFWAYATGTWIFGASIATVSATAWPTLVPVLASFAGVSLFVAGLYSYRRTMTLEATAFCSFGSLYVAIGAIYASQAGGFVSSTYGSAVIMGFLLESFAFIALSLSVAASMRGSFGLTGAFGAACIGYALIGIAYFLSNGTIGHGGILSSIGGWFLCGAAVFAYYVGAASVVNSTSEREVLPTGNRL